MHDQYILTSHMYKCIYIPCICHNAPASCSFMYVAQHCKNALAVTDSILCCSQQMWFEECSYCHESFAERAPSLS